MANATSPSTDQRRGRATAVSGSSGRYEQGTLREARLPANGVGRPPPNLGNRTPVRDVGLAAVPDPMDDRGRPMLAAVNRRVDVLEQERSGGHISEGAYRVGRMIQQVLEIKLRSSSNWLEAGGSRDMREAQIMMLARGKVRAEEIGKIEAKLARLLGELGVKFMTDILGKGVTFKEKAGALASQRRMDSVRWRFRSYLEELAEKWGQ